MFAFTRIKPLASKRQAVRLNSRTLKIAEESKKEKLVLYVWVALNTHLFYGNNSPTYKRLAEECGSTPQRVKSALLWLKQCGYILMYPNGDGRMKYELT